MKLSELERVAKDALGSGAFISIRRPACATLDGFMWIAEADAGALCITARGRTRDDAKASLYGILCFLLVRGYNAHAQVAP